jgi:hypothetical protein
MASVNSLAPPQADLREHLAFAMSVAIALRLIPTELGLYSSITYSG